MSKLFGSLGNRSFVGRLGGIVILVGLGLGIAATGRGADGPAPTATPVNPATEFEAEVPYSTGAPIGLNLRMKRTALLDEDGKPKKDYRENVIDASFAEWVELKSLEWTGSSDEGFTVQFRGATEPQKLLGFGVTLTLVGASGRTLYAATQAIPGPLDDAGAKAMWVQCEVPIRREMMPLIKTVRISLCELGMSTPEPAAELKALIASEGLARREGRCLIVGHEDTFCDAHLGGDASNVYIYRGFLKEIGLHHISFYGYEEGYELLLDPESGRRTVLQETPKFSPDNKWLATGVIDEMNGPTAARIYRVTKSGADMVWEYQPKGYPGGKDQPLVEPVWVSAKEVRFRAGGMEDEGKPKRMVSVKLADGKWRRAD